MRLTPGGVLAQLVLRPMRPRHARRPRTWRYAVAGLLAAFLVSQWFAGVYVTPPRADLPGRTDVVWRSQGEPFFNSPAVPGFEGGPAGRVLLPGLPFWSYAYRQSLRAAARTETVTVGATRAPSPEARAPDAAPSAEPRTAAAPSAEPRVAATPAATPRVAV